MQGIKRHRLPDSRWKPIEWHSPCRGGYYPPATPNFSKHLVEWQKRQVTTPLASPRGKSRAVVKALSPFTGVLSASNVTGGIRSHKGIGKLAAA